MKTLKDELRECLSEMQETAKKFEKLMNTPGIEWPVLEDLPGLVKVAKENCNSCTGCYYNVEPYGANCQHPLHRTMTPIGCADGKFIFVKV